MVFAPTKGAQEKDKHLLFSGFGPLVQRNTPYSPPTLEFGSSAFPLARGGFLSARLQWTFCLVGFKGAPTVDERFSGLQEPAVGNPSRGCFAQGGQAGKTQDANRA